MLSNAPAKPDWMVALSIEGSPYLRTYLSLGVVHSVLDKRDGKDELVGDLLNRVLLDKTINGLEGADLGAPTLGRLERRAKDGHDLPGGDGRDELDERVNSALGTLPDGERLVREDAEEDREEREEDGLDADSKVDNEPTNGNGGDLALAGVLGSAPGGERVEDAEGGEVRDGGTLDGERELVGLELGRRSVLRGGERDEEVRDGGGGGDGGHGPKEGV